MARLSTSGARTRVLGVFASALCLVLAQASAAGAQDAKMTVRGLMDRAQIEDLLTRYYYNLGRGSADSFSAFYADGAELTLGPKTYKGKDGIESAYKAAAPHVIQQGREYDHLVKVKGHWRFTSRQIMPGAQAPAGWTG